MLDPRLAASLIDCSSGKGYSSTRIFGVRLRRLCLWHIFLLKAIDSPYVKKGRATMWDLRTAIGICRLRFGDSRVHRPWLVPILLYCWAFLRSPFGMRHRLRSILTSRSDAFFLFCADYIQDPEYAVIPPELNNIQPRFPRGRADDTIEHVADLINWTKWDDRKIWELPLGYANWLRMFAQRDAGADVDVTTEAEKKIQSTLPPEYRFKIG